MKFFPSLIFIGLMLRIIARFSRLSRVWAILPGVVQAQERVPSDFCFVVWVGLPLDERKEI
jgi:hypothetical protein